MLARALTGGRVKSGLALALGTGIRIARLSAWTMLVTGSRAYALA